MASLYFRKRRWFHCRIHKQVFPFTNHDLKEGGEHMDTSLNSILEVALQQGIWAALYIYLFFRMLKESAAREAKYQSITAKDKRQKCTWEPLAWLF